MTAKAVRQRAMQQQRAVRRAWLVRRALSKNCQGHRCANNALLDHIKTLWDFLRVLNVRLESTRQLLEVCNVLPVTAVMVNHSLGTPSVRRVWVGNFKTDTVKLHAWNASSESIPLRQAALRVCSVTLARNNL